MKVNLNDIKAQLVKRGRDAYQNEELEAELTALDPDTEGDAFLFPEATFEGDTSTEAYINHKNLWRNRVQGMADRLEIGKLSVNWTIQGEMVVSLQG